jgi:hypothetical protein
MKYSRNVVLGTGNLNVLSGTLKKTAKGTVVKLIGSISQEWISN